MDDPAIDVERAFGALAEDRMRRLAVLLARRCAPGVVVLLRGPLGAGKTTFSRALATGLGIDPGEVRSPTYTVCMVHASPAGAPDLVHLDLYRMDESGITTPAFEALGLEHGELPPAGAMLVVEWSERWADPPADTLVVALSRDPADIDRRQLAVTATGERHLALLRAWIESVDGDGETQNAAFKA